eukprot:gene46704-57194_t
MDVEQSLHLCLSHSVYHLLEDDEDGFLSRYLQRLVLANQTGGKVVAGSTEQVFVQVLRSQEKDFVALYSALHGALGAPQMPPPQLLHVAEELRRWAGQVLGPRRSRKATESTRTLRKRSPSRSPSPSPSPPLPATLAAPAEARNLGGSSSSAKASAARSSGFADRYAQALRSLGEEPHGSQSHATAVERQYHPYSAGAEARDDDGDDQPPPPPPSRSPPRLRTGAGRLRSGSGGSGGSIGGGGGREGGSVDGPQGLTPHSRGRANGAPAPAPASTSLSPLATIGRRAAEEALPSPSASTDSLSLNQSLSQSLGQSLSQSFSLGQSMSQSARPFSLFEDAAGAPVAVDEAFAGSLQQIEALHRQL